MKAKIKAKVNIKKSQTSDTPFLLRLDITNQSDSDIHILKWETPLEGLFSDCFEVLRDGEPVPYDGPLVKRSTPTSKDYVRIPSNKKVSAEIDLSTAYQVSAPGNYEVRYRGCLHDVASKSELRAKAKPSTREQTPMRLKIRPKKLTVRTGKSGHGRATAGEVARHQREASNSLTPKAKMGAAKKKKSSVPKPPKLTGGTASEKSAEKKAHKQGYKLVIEALAELSNNRRYREWFGAHNATRFARVRGVHMTVRDEMKNETYTYDLTGTGCQSGWFAYTYKGSSTIWFCGSFWSAPPTGTDSKAGTVVHEHTHASASTDDVTYGQSKCRNLAISDPNSAVNNADNYEYYARG